MTEAEWLESDDPQAMLRLLMSVKDDLSGTFRPSDRRLRLFACACLDARAALWPSYIGATAEDWRIAEEGANPQARGGNALQWARSWCDPNEPPVPPEVGHLPPSQVAAFLHDIVGNPWRPVSLCELCPPGDLSQCDERQRVITPDALSLARAAYEDRPTRPCGRCRGTGKELAVAGWSVGVSGTDARPTDYSPIHGTTCPDCQGAGLDAAGTLCPVRLAVLADALEEAGCPVEVEEACPSCGGRGDIGTLGGTMGCMKCSTDHRTRGTGKVLSPNPLLAHLRGPGPHVRGCWALDCVLGKG